MLLEGGEESKGIGVGVGDGKREGERIIAGGFRSLFL